MSSYSQSYYSETLSQNTKKEEENRKKCKTKGFNTEENKYIEENKI